MADRDYRGGSLMRRPMGALGRPSRFGWASSPWSELAEVRRQMDDLASSFFGPSFAFPSPRWAPGDWEMEPDVDVIEKEGEFAVYAALPGVKPEDIKVEATDDTIRLSAEYRNPWEETTTGQPEDGSTENVRQHRQSRISQQGSFQFSYTFPQDIQADKAQASFNNGRLELRLPKLDRDISAARPRQIPVNTGQAQLAGSPQTSTSNKPGPTLQESQQSAQRRPQKKAA